MQVTQVGSTEGVRSALWDVTGSCNLRCTHCYQFDRYNYAERGPYRHDLTTDEALRVLDRLTEANFTHIHFLGGEPLLRKDLPRIVEVAKSRGMYLSVNTNGIPLTTARTSRLAAAGVDQFMVSLDGATAATNDALRGRGTFEVACRNMQAAVGPVREAGGTVGIAFTATPTNAFEIPDLFALALDTGVEVIHIVLAAETGNYVYNEQALGEVDDTYFIECIDRALAVHGPSLVRRVRIRVDLRLWPIEVLNRKHGPLLEADPIGIKCQGGKKFVTVQADGTLGPCSAAMDPKYTLPVIQTGHLNAPVERVQTIAPGRFDANSMLQAFYRFQEDPATFAGLEPCERCRFYRTQCEPCPLEYTRERVIKQCLWAEREEARRRVGLLASALVPGNGFALRGETLVRDADRFEIALGPLLGAVVEASSTALTPLGAVLEGSFATPLSDEQREGLLSPLDDLVCCQALRTEMPIVGRPDHG